MSFKPSGYSSLSPYVIVDDAQAALTFMKSVFGADPLRVMRGDDGAIRHCEAKVDDTVVMVGQSPGAPDSHLHLYVPDVDAMFAAGIAAGGTEFEAPGDQPYGERRAAVRDPAGITWWFASCLADKS